MTKIVWLRNDLRIDDNRALHYASVSGQGSVVVIVTIMPDFWAQHHESPRKIGFWLDAVKQLHAELALLNIPLVFIETHRKTLVTDLQKLFTRLEVSDLYFNKMLEPNEQQRDLAVKEMCHDLSIKVHVSNQSCLLPPGSVLKLDNTPYSVFTPFKNKWLQVINDMNIDCVPKPLAQPKINLPSSIPQLNFLDAQYDYDQTLWPPTEAAAQHRLKTFVAKELAHYGEQRDLPAINGTSTLSPYLAAGIISPQRCLQVLSKAKDSAGKATWLNELIWRDFYKHILHHYPRVGKGRAFNLITEKVVWHNNETHFLAWCQGKTGVPIVDAAMRQLNQTGWMHNRLRMVSAMFLSKNLFLNWRLGERYFMENLLDGDLAANNGGWQWSASTGVDSAPYFRVFNPYRQSERFDPKGDFIRQYCPELAELDHKQIHNPPIMDSYPAPIVDVKQSRAFAIEQFKNLRQKTQ